MQSEFADPQFLRGHIREILRFYAPVVLDEASGGFHNQLLDDGTVYDPATKHVVGTCRFVVNYALAAQLFPDEAEEHLRMCAHGIRFLMEHHRDAARGGFFWIVEAGGGGVQVRDGTKYCYAAAFALLLAGPILDAFALAFVPFVWQTITSAYIALATEDDKRAAFAVWLGTLGFGAQIFPAQRVLDVASVATLEATRPGLPTVWAHGTFGLVWLLNWSTFGASLRARDVVSDDAVYVSAFLLRPSLFWLLSFALDVASRRPFHGIDDYITSALGAR